jgi:BASS family bile acid:Na+ symporter
MDLRQVLQLFVLLSVAALIASAGMNATRDDLLYLIRRPRLLGRAVLSVNIVTPLLAMALTALFPLPPAVRAGILVMSVSPVPPVVPTKGLQLGCSKGYTYGLFVALALLSVVIVPITVWLVGEYYRRDLHISAATVARTILLTVVLPLAAGLSVQHFARAFAERASPHLARISTALLILLILPLVVTAWPHLMVLVGNGAVLAIAGVALGALVAGHLLGGPASEDRAALALTSALRHPGIAMLIVNENFDNKQIAAAVLLFLLVSVIVVTGYQAWL